jgi:hypothetical protein
MIPGLQILGILFGLVMIYFTFINFKRKDYDAKDFSLWLVVWLFFLVMTIFPKIVYGIMESLEIQRTVDFFVIGGFMFFSIIIFYLYKKVRKTEKKIEEIVRKVALRR